MRVLLAGAWGRSVYEEACARALSNLGVEVIPFRWSRYFSGLVGRAEAKYLLSGPRTIRLNRDLIRETTAAQPDVVFVWRGGHIFPETLRRIREGTNARLVSYNNDDPFSPVWRAGPLHWRRLWHRFIATIPHYNLHFVFRERNVGEFRSAGAGSVEILLPYYVPDLHDPCLYTGAELEPYRCDVVFIGNYEPVRLEYVRALVNAGLDVRLFGFAKYWSQNRLGSLSSKFNPVRPLYGRQYGAALAAARVALCCFSRLNRDDCTTRVFEIPACGSVLLSERTPAVERLFRENEEAVYFDSATELVAKARALLRRADQGRAIAEAGRRRCLAGGHSSVDRMRFALDCMKRLL